MVSVWTHSTEQIQRGGHAAMGHAHAILQHDVLVLLDELLLHGTHSREEQHQPIIGIAYSFVDNQLRN